MINGFIKYMEENRLSKNSINSYYSDVKLFEEYYMTSQDVNKLKHYAAKDEKNSKRDYCFIILLTNGGLRESELVNIKLTDIKLNERIINILGKGNKFRQILHFYFCIIFLGLIVPV